MRPGAYGRRGERRLDSLLSTLRRGRLEPHVPEGAVLVDLGCGHGGDLLRRLAPRLERGIGFDVSVGDPPAPNVELHAQPADEELPVPDESADVVSCLAVIEHVERPDTLVAEARRILKPGGTFVVTTPSRQAKPLLELLSLRLRLIDPVEILDHKRYYTPASLSRELEAQGFASEAVDVSRFELWLNLCAVARR